MKNTYPPFQDLQISERENSLPSAGALVAQRIERYLRKVEVAGSNPAGDTTSVALRDFSRGATLILGVRIAIRFL